MARPTINAKSIIKNRKNKNSLWHKMTLIQKIKLLIFVYLR